MNMEETVAHVLFYSPEVVRYGIERLEEPRTLSCSLQQPEEGAEFSGGARVVGVGSYIQRTCKGADTRMSTWQEQSLLYRTTICTVPIHWATEKTVNYQNTCTGSRVSICVDPGWAVLSSG